MLDLTLASAMIGEGTDYADLAIKDELNVEEYGVAFRKGSDAPAAVNEAFAELRAPRRHAGSGRKVRPDPGGVSHGRGCGHLGPPARFVLA